MSDTPAQDSLYNNLANGRQSPFRDLPHNEMMLMTDRRARQFLMRVLAALESQKADQVFGDFDMTPLHFWEITQNTKLQ